MSATPSRDWSAVKALFFEALDLGPAERAAFLSRACGADAGLRTEVQSLLAAHDDDRPFLDVTPVAGAARVLSIALEQAEAPAIGLPPGTRIAQYEVLEPLGSGGMGAVYRARDTKLDRFVALKIVFDTAANPTADRVLREARAASALNHPNICTLYEAGEFEGQPYLAMEYIAGQSLSSVIPPGGFDAAEVINYGVQIADALAHAHEHGVIHRDLKSANVVVTPQGRAKVLDFGIARRFATVGAGAESAPVAKGSTTSGTLPYMAPELLRGHASDARSDIWALGVLLYELAVGRRPFVGDTALEVTSAILKEMPPPLPAKMPADLRAVILRCLERNPDDRFQRASDAMTALETLDRATRVAASQPFRHARRVVLGLGVAVALLVAAYAVYQGRGGAHGASGSPAVSLAVLPFKVLSGAQEIGYLALGIPDTIGSQIAVKSIRVRSALVSAKGEEPQAVGRRLGVGYVVTGTIQKDGERMGITPRLVRVEDGVVIWTSAYTVPSTDLLQVHDEIARGIVQVLPIRLTSQDRARVNRQYTRDPEAYALYARGRAGVGPIKEPNTLAAVASFQQALARDPNYALAHAGLALTSARMCHLFAKEDEVSTWQKRAHEAAQRAVALAPELAETHEALAAVYRSAEFDWEATVAESMKALELNPGLDQPHLFLASAFMHLGLLDRAGAEARTAMDLNEANVDEPLRVQGAAAMYGGRYEAAIPLLKQARGKSNATAEWNLAYGLYNVGLKTEAESMLLEIRSGSARQQRRAQATLASFLAARDKRAEARKLIDAVIQGSYMDHHVAYSLGAAYAQLDIPKEALRWLTEARRTGYACYPWFEGDPLLAPLRQTAAFRSFLDEFRQSWGTKKAQFGAER